MDYPAALRRAMAPLEQVLRATTHVLKGAQVSSGVTPPAPLDEFQQHGTSPQFQRDEIAKAEARDMAALMRRAQFEQECG